MILHWNGIRWSRVASPNAGLLSELTSAAATSATSIWAAGILINTAGNEQTLILHWNGTRWKRVASPNPGGPARPHQLNAITASSATSARAVGTFVDPVQGRRPSSSAGMAPGGRTRRPRHRTTASCWP